MIRLIIHFLYDVQICLLDDGDMQTGCNPNLSGDEGLENDEEDDADWRMMRLERETWLKEHVMLIFLYCWKTNLNHDFTRLHKN
jgi:hypothetical protein